MRIVVEYVCFPFVSSEDTPLIDNACDAITLYLRQYKVSHTVTTDSEIVVTLDDVQTFARLLMALRDAINVYGYHPNMGFMMRDKDFVIDIYAA